MSCKFKGRIVWFASVLLLVLPYTSASHVLSAEKQPSSKINYKLVPNLEPMKDNSPTPDFTLPDLFGKKVWLKDFRRKLVLLNFWASWCLPCREEMPAMERLYQEFKNRDFVILAVNIKDKRKDALAFVKEFKLTYPVVFDPEGQVGLPYGAWGLPTTYLIGRKGEGLARMWGPADWYSPGARELIKALLDEKK
jgi:peroxiredoxin